MFRRVVFPLLLLTALALIIPTLRHAPASKAGVLSSLGPDVPAYQLDGLNETVTRAGMYAHLVAQQEAAAEARRAVEVARTRATQPNRTPALNPRTGVNWDGIARCETGSNWQHQTRYDGGLGILHAAWIEFGGRDFAEYGSQASRAQQIVVAERIYARYGLSGWGCRAYG
jgi:hypothetical protein